MIQHTRWTPVRKLAVLTAIQKGEFTREAFMEANNVSDEEMCQWESGAKIGKMKVSGHTGHLKARAR